HKRARPPRWAMTRWPDTSGLWSKMTRTTPAFWIVDGLPRAGGPHKQLPALTWRVVGGPFPSRDAAAAAVAGRELRPHWVIVEAVDRRRAVVAAHRAAGLHPPSRDAIP